MKNKLGQKLTRGVLQELWASSAYPFRRSKLVNLLDAKAHDVYCLRMAEAIDREASDEELEAINARDVKLTVWDVVEDWLLSFRIPTFLAAVYHWLVDEPDYSAIRPF